MITKDINKNVKYINRNFEDVRNALIEFLKVYFPNEFTSISNESVEMIIVELLSYITDLTGFYQNVKFTESLFFSATDRTNIINQAQSLFGYRPKVSAQSHAQFMLYQLIPATTEMPQKPDWNYSLILSDLQIGADGSDTTFIPNDGIIDFSNTLTDGTVISEYSKGNDGSVLFYLLEKPIAGKSGSIETYTYDVGNAQKFLTITIPDDNVLEIIDVVGSDGTVWYEVPYLAYNKIVDDIPVKNDLRYAHAQHNTPYILNYKNVDTRFISRLVDNKLMIQFGSGVTQLSDIDILPSPKYIGTATFNKNIDPRNFLLNRSYGLSPSNVTLTIRYLKGYTGNTNFAADSLNKIKNVNFISNGANLIGSDLQTFNYIKSTLTVNNITAATGGRGPESLYEIKENAIASYPTQNRCVTTPDYEIRILSLHPKYGSVAKVKVVNNSNLIATTNSPDETLNKLSVSSLSAFCLGYDENNNLVPLSDLIKGNIKTYLDEYRMATDTIEIRDAYVINIGVNFSVSIFDDIIDKKEVLLKCITALKDYFDISKWTIGQPIIIHEIYNLLAVIPGVRSIVDIEIVNKSSIGGSPYSNVYYPDIMSKANVNGVIYTALDPSIFEVKLPDNDIVGTIVN
jgi:hypothetical protein